MNVVTTSPLPTGRVGVPYSTNIILNAGGNPQPLVLILGSGSLPNGLDNTALVKRVSQDGSFFGSPTEGEKITGQTSGTVGVVYKNIATFMHYFPISGSGFILGEQVDGELNGPLGLIDSAVTNSIIYANRPSFFPTIVPSAAYNDLSWTISGIPTQAGTYTFNLTIYDEALTTFDAGLFTITILPSKKKKRTGVVIYPSTFCADRFDRFGREIQCKDTLEFGQSIYQKISTDDRYCCYKRIN